MPVPTAAPALRVATYNVHACVGLDRRRDVRRVARVLGELDADIIGLQEVLGPGADLEDMTVWPLTSDSDSRDIDQLAVFADTLAYEARAGANLLRAGRRYGNALLSRHPIVTARRLDLAQDGREPRGAIDALVRTPGGPLRVVVTHFGLAGPERAWQADRLAALLETPHAEAGQPPAGTVLLGDFNDMWPPSPTYGPLIDRQGSQPPWRRTWPALTPLLPLDKVWPCRGAPLVSAAAWRSRTARLASDHLPLVGRLALPAGAGPVLP
ncbi:endonuclease/exonuclease/phosphatase family protein [Roseospira goensis]|uniref:Endonuclease/exonuclease/phosphatase family metal-dependent hydrolase n=1 Tax=Roseospira goensis TaxID=391922 RepID=A0A7W6S0V8_9PROT|nr:endonuclease/exonuclease/phosphatase family protein [Roseospira goensis]MBB4286833.1 endonuclease/exonuclease/phosphatase family metal-dependent hydrolase [Roseospira goensis]